MDNFKDNGYDDTTFLLGMKEQVKYLTMYLHHSSAYNYQSCRKYFPFRELGKREKVVCEMKLLFTIACINISIGLQLYLLKRSFDKVTDSGFQAIKVFGDVENE